MTDVLLAMWVLYVLAGLVVLAEALNKLEQLTPRKRGLAVRERLHDIVQAAAWSALAVGAFLALISPFYELAAPDLQDVLVLLGVAVLIIHRRSQEQWT